MEDCDFWVELLVLVMFVVFVVGWFGICFRFLLFGIGFMIVLSDLFCLVLVVLLWVVLWLIMFLGLIVCDIL